MGRYIGRAGFRVDNKTSFKPIEQRRWLFGRCQGVSFPFVRSPRRASLTHGKAGNGTQRFTATKYNPKERGASFLHFHSEVAPAPATRYHRSVAYSKLYYIASYLPSYRNQDEFYVGRGHVLALKAMRNANERIKTNKKKS